MHTSTFTDADDNKWTVHHNSDWSGDVHIIFPDGISPSLDDLDDMLNNDTFAVKIPGIIIKGAVYNLALDDVIDKIEGLYKE